MARRAILMSEPETILLAWPTRSAKIDKLNPAGFPLPGDAERPRVGSD